MKSLFLRAACRGFFIAVAATALLPAQAEEKKESQEKTAEVQHPELKAFPPAKEGMQRFVIVLPQKERGEEDGFRVELIPGKKMMTDGRNLYHLGEILKEVDLKGWGYTYFECGEGVPRMTLMAPGPDPVEKFVTGQPVHIRYNSRLPIVIYAPAGYEIRYRIWRADETHATAPRG